MLKNKFYLYGSEAITVPGHLHVGKFMLNTIKSFGTVDALVSIF